MSASLPPAGDLSEARRAVSTLFGRGGYVTYSAALGRTKIKFHQSISNPACFTSRLVLATCDLLALAQSLGADPRETLTRPLPEYGICGITNARHHAETLLDSQAVSAFAIRLERDETRIEHSLASDRRRYYPHFARMVAALDVIAATGDSPRQALRYRHHWARWDEA